MNIKQTTQDRAVSKQKLCLLILEALALVVLAGIASSFTFREPDLNLANFMRIERGMSVNEVNDIFGMRGKKGPCMVLECSWIWRHGDIFAEITFGQRDEKVSGGHFVTPDGKQHFLPRERQRK